MQTLATFLAEELQDKLGTAFASHEVMVMVIWLPEPRYVLMFE